MGRPDALAEQKTLSMERSISYLRALVIGLNTGIYIVFMRDRPGAPLAWAVIGVAVTYALWSVLSRPYERYPLLRVGVATLVADNVLILLWILATGGPHSEFWMIYFISVVSVAMRYDLAHTMVAASAEAATYTVAMIAQGGATTPDLILRAAYVLMCGLASGLLARQERISREERRHYEQLAEMEAATVARLEELNELRSTFIANAAHELRTPMTTIFGATTTLAGRFDDLDRDGIRTLLESTIRQSRRIRVLLDNLLDLAQLDGNAMLLEMGVCRVDEIVAEVLDLAPPPAGVRVSLDIPASLTVSADAPRLQQVLTNLIVNAYRYGGPSIAVRARARGPRVEIEVADDGSGVPASLLPRLFEPFSRGDNAGGQIGSGLGLSLSRRLVRALGGRLTYEPQQGSCFRISLLRPDGSPEGDERELTLRDVESGQRIVNDQLNSSTTS